MLSLKRWPWGVSLLIQASFSGTKSVRREDEEVGDRAGKRWLWLFTRSSIHFSVWEFSIYIYGKVIEGHRQTLFIQRLVIIFLCDMTFSYLVRKESLLEGKKWKKKNKAHLSILLPAWHLFLCPSVVLRKIMVLIEYFFSDDWWCEGFLPALVMGSNGL